MKNSARFPALSLMLLSALLTFGWLGTASQAIAQTIERSAFQQGTISPFYVCTSQPPNNGQISTAPKPIPWWNFPDPKLGYHKPIWNHTVGAPQALNFTWTQTGYDGTRLRRGVEACSGFSVAREGWYGFMFYPPSDADGYPHNKLGAIAQIFQPGYCNSWGSLLIVRDGGLYLQYRSSCGAPTEVKLADSIKYDQWNPIILHWVNSNIGEGQIQVWYGDATHNPNTPTYDAQEINFGFAHGWTPGGPLPAGSEQGLKFGMYNFDDHNYTPGEVRTMYYDNVTQMSGSSNSGWWQVNPTY